MRFALGLKLGDCTEANKRGFKSDAIAAAPMPALARPRKCLLHTCSFNISGFNSLLLRDNLIKV